MHSTRERVPLQWAAMQTNLGNALATLGERTHDRAKLEEARRAVNAAFDVLMQAGRSITGPTSRVVCAKSTTDSRCTLVLFQPTSRFP
jgi:hypothetical protein